MPFNTVTVCVAVAPTVVSTWFSHYLHRRSLHQKPIRDISYHEGLHIIRKFMYYASHHTVEDIQAFTSQSVATPHWVKAVEVKIGEDYLDSSADKLITQLGPKGIARVGGIKWWQWRGGSSLKAEWIQMRRDYQERKNDNSRCKRVILYIHGGAYFFGSVDASRYQMQRHARKLGGRVFARLARYRLAPQFPFPCGLQDCIAAYLFLLSVQEPTEIILSGDSAGAGMVLTMLVVLRDQGLPLPAGAVLLSPWVDLLHSFPSMGSDGKRDFLPLHGFMQRPSLSWPPPNADELDAILKNAKRRPDSIPDSPSIAMPDTSRDLQTAIQGFSVHEQDNPQLSRVQDNNMSRSLPSVREHLSIVINGKIVEIKDQVQMYTTNDLLNHPLVSPIFQPSLGGLPPLLVMTGGGELLRDEQIYIAHKAANPPAYPPSEDTLNKHDPYREIITKYQPTYVQLQIWDDLCHVAPTLSFTKPAKHMFRSIAQFSAWALARAQDSDIDIPNGEEEVEESTDSTNGMPTKQPGNIPGPAFRTCVGKAGDPLPPFRRHMIRQRVDRNGKIYPLPDESLFPSLNIPPSKIGAVNAVPLRRWMSAKQLWDTKYSSEKLRAQEKRIHELIYGVAHYEPGELPPPSSLAARKGAYIRRVEERQRKSRAMTIWSRWGAKDDIKALARDARGLFPGVSNEKVPRPAGAAGAPAGPAKPVPQTATPNVGARPRVTSGTRTVSDRGQATDDSVPFDRQGSSSRRDPDRFDFTLTTPTQTSDEHIYSTEPDSNNTNHGSRMDYVLSGGIVNDIVNEKRKSLSANANTEGASAASVRNAEGVISPVPGRAAALAPELEPEPASDASSAKFDWRTPNEFAALTPQDTPSIYSQDTNNNEAPAFRSISAARGRVSGKGKKAAATGATPPPPSTRVANNSSAGYFKFKPKKMLYDFDSANNLAPSDTEPFPPFPTTSNSSRNPSIGSRPSYRQGASGFRSWGRA